MNWLDSGTVWSVLGCWSSRPSFLLLYFAFCHVVGILLSPVLLFFSLSFPVATYTLHHHATAMPPPLTYFLVGHRTEKGRETSWYCTGGIVKEKSITFTIISNYCSFTIMPWHTETGRNFISKGKQKWGYILKEERTTTNNKSGI